MAKKLIILRNIGKQDVQKYGVEPYTQGQVVSVDDKEADTLLKVLKVAEPWIAESEKSIRAVPPASETQTVAPAATLRTTESRRTEKTNT